ncbi:MAG: OmpH family outer membrane protein [Veillonellales bacterium]
MKSKNRIFLVFLAMALLLGAMGTAQASPAASPVGFVDYLYLINHHPDTPKANEALKAEQDQDKQQFAEKSANLSDQDKQALDRQLGQQIEQKRLELLKPITENINAAIKDVADAKGLSVVVGKNTVIYGGTDITQDVLQKIGGK